MLQSLFIQKQVKMTFRWRKHSKKAISFLKPIWCRSGKDAVTVILAFTARL